MRFLVLGLFLMSGSAVFYAQTVDVTVTTDKRQVEAILKKQREATRINQAYFAEDEKCRLLLKASDWAKAEASCRLAITLVEKLPKEHVLERSSSRLALAIALLFQRKADEAITLLNVSLEIGKPILDDTDAETGERYLFLGHAHRLVGDFEASAKFYTKAETTYRTAFRDIGDSELRRPYARSIISVLQAHVSLIQTSGNESAASLVEKRLADAKNEFGEYLKEES